jgi:hypothetical protein
MIGVPVLILLLSGVMLSTFVAPPLLAKMLLAGEGVAMLLCGFLALGMTVMLPEHLSCPHGHQSSRIRVGFWTGKPSLEIDPTHLSPHAWAHQNTQHSHQPPSGWQGPPHR